MGGMDHCKQPAYPPLRSGILSHANSNIETPLSFVFAPPDSAVSLPGPHFCLARGSRRAHRFEYNARAAQFK